MTDEIWQWNTATTVENMRRKSVSAREVAEAHIARLDSVNPALNAVTFDVRESALAAADRCDQATADGTSLGPLHGVAITIKENIDVAGEPTPNGVTAFADVIAPTDSPLVGHLTGAGAVIVGRTNTPEMSYRWHTENPLRGETKNPWSINRTAGGSSGGAAASVAAGIGTIAHGNDLGGSVRQPANCCGLASIRPTLGRVAAHNDSASAERTLGLQLMSVQGPLAREVADVRIGLEIMCQPSSRDPWYAPAPLGSGGAGPLRVAVTYGSSDTPTDPEVKEAVDNAATHLIDAGYEVEFLDPPSLSEIRSAWRSILATEVISGDVNALYSVTSEQFARAVGWMFEDDAVLDLPAYILAFSRRSELLREWSLFLDERPLVVSPVSQRVPFAPNADVTSRESFMEIYEGHAPLVAMNYLGLPAATVPTLLTPDGPIGVQITGARFNESACLDAAAAIEQRAGVMANQLWHKLTEI